MVLMFLTENLLTDVSFSPGHCKGSFSSPEKETNEHNESTEEHWDFFNYIGGGTTGVVFPSTVQNPNKAICTINAKTSEVINIY